MQPETGIIKISATN